MNTFLVNASNLKAGGGIQVTQSISEQLQRHKKCHFIVVLSTYIKDNNLDFGDNVELYHYDIKHNLRTVLFGRDSFLDGLVEENKIDAVLTMFGPSIWRPRVPHLCGFARAQLILKDSPYYKNRSLKERVVYGIWNWAFKRSSKVFYTENEYTSRILEKFYKGVKVYTVSNYYNQIFDRPEKWNRGIVLSAFNGATCLSIASPTPHKNFGIIEGIVRYLREVHPEFKVRFVLTFNKDQWPIDEDVREHIIYVGKVDVTECPYLYKQCDIMFMPSLLECFTATYPEAMRMERPIVTTDMEFAKGLCGDAACYYSAIDPEAAAEAIYKVATNKEYAAQLVVNGKEQLKKFDNYEQRADKLIKILEEIVNNK